MQYIHNYTSRQSKFKTTCDQILSERLKNIQTSGSLTDLLPYLFSQLWGTYPHKIDLGMDGAYMCEKFEDQNSKKNKFSCIKIEYADDIDIDDDDIIDDLDDDDLDELYTFKNKNIQTSKSSIKLLKNYTGDEIAVYRCEETPVVVIGDDIKTILFEQHGTYYCYSYTEELNPYIIENVIVDEDDEGDRYFDYVVYGQHGFNTTELPIKRQNISVEDNYNDDLPHEQIKDFIENAEAGLCILHGQPGTGKTTYIRHIMRECKDTDFMVLNTSCFDMITDPSFVNLIVNNQGSVVILEDCEDMLAERSGNSRIATLLNLSDGILGDALRLKFICTFNANIGKIDPAILRKGRTHIKYEFKPLTKDKAENLAKKLGVVLPERKGNQGYSLADIYNIENKLVDDTNTNKVGFSNK